MTELLNKFKRSMHITHDTEDDNLLDILTASEKDIISLGGDLVNFKEETEELIINRSRYVYNDMLEFFYDNFQENILNLSLRVYSFKSHNIGDDIE